MSEIEIATVFAIGSPSIVSQSAIALRCCERLPASDRVRTMRDSASRRAIGWRAWIVRIRCAGHG